MDELDLLRPIQLDHLLNIPLGMSTKLAKAGKFPHLVLPEVRDNIRFRKTDVEQILHPERTGGATVAQLLKQYEQEIGAQHATRKAKL